MNVYPPRWYRAVLTVARYIVLALSVGMIVWITRDTIDGISLTVARVETDRFSISAIPHTVAVTILSEKQPGDTVNLETDIIGKYVEKLLRPRETESAPSGGLTLEFLAQNGF